MAMNPTIHALTVLAMATTTAATAASAAVAPELARPAPRFPLNDTGLTSCYHSDPTLCGAEDASHGRDVQFPGNGDGRAGFSWRKIGANGEVLPANASAWNCIEDRVTGLVWEVKTNDGGLHDQGHVYSNEGNPSYPPDASAFVNAVNAQGWCGAHDWRLPTRGELEGLLAYGAYGSGPFIDAAWFVNTPAADFWSSTTYASNASLAGWVVSFSDGAAKNIWRQFFYSARLVRGAPPPASVRRFKVRDTEVLDRATGLVWQRCSAGQSWSGTTCSGSGTTMSWAGALSHAAATAQASGKPWRLPSAKEISSIAALERYAPAIDPVAFPATIMEWGYWSSSWYDRNGLAVAPQAWFMYGNVSYHPVTEPAMARLVRSATTEDLR